jgi:predicted dehydrogenase
VRDWRGLVALEAASQTRFGVNAQVRYNPKLTRCREALQSGKLGKVRFIDCSAGGTIADQGVHVIDWAMSLNDDEPVVAVFGAASGSRDLAHPMHPSPDTTVAKLEFANGVRGLWNLGYSAPRVLDRDAYYVHLRVAAYADCGHVLFEQFGRWEIVSPNGVEGGRTDWETWTDVDTVAQANFTNAMFDWLEDGDNPPGTNLKRSLEQWNAVLGLYASTICRRPVDIPFDPPDDLWESLSIALA